MEQFFDLWGPVSLMFWVRAIWAMVAFIIMVWMARIGRLGIRRVFQRTRAHANAIVFVAHVTQLGILFLGALLALAILGVDLPALTAFVGLGTIALSLSFQDIARSLLAGLYLLIERPFDVGDLIEVGGQQGIIQDVRIRTTILRCDNGDRVIIPNLVMFTSTIVQKRAQANSNGS